MTPGWMGTESVHDHHDHQAEDHDDGNEFLPLWAAKVLSAILMIAVSALCCLIPVYIARQARKHSRKGREGSRLRVFQALLSIINCFAAGAFLGLALIHVLPEAVSQLNARGFLLVLEGGSSHHSHPYNIAYLLAAVGFTAMLGVETLLGGGHSHCHHDSSLSLGSPTTRPPGAFVVAVPDSALGGHSPVPSPRSLPHSSHQHAQHHVLCTTANYCPDCDDCLEAITTVNGMSGERELPAGGSVELSLAMPSAPASTPPSVDDLTIVSPGKENGASSGTQTHVNDGCKAASKTRGTPEADGAATHGEICGVAFAKAFEAPDVAASRSDSPSPVSPSSARKRESCSSQRERSRSGEPEGRKPLECCGEKTGCRGSRRAADEGHCVHAGGCCGANGEGATRCCHGHSHCPDSASRIHSGSIGVNVQGGDNLGGRQPDRLCSDGSACESLERRGSNLSNPLASGFPSQAEESNCFYKPVDDLIPPSQAPSSGGPGPYPGDKCGRFARGKAGPGALLHRHEEVGRSAGANALGKRKIQRLQMCCASIDSAKISLAVALGVHAIFEGIILGTTQSSQNVWIATLAILGHKGAEAVAVASAVLKMNMSTVPFVVMLAAFILASPLGILVGVFAATGGTAVSGVFNALAVGAILYATNEMLSEFSGSCSCGKRVVKLLAFIVGLGVLFGLDLIHTPFCGHNHSDHGHGAHEAHSHEMHDHSRHHG
ncbi:hypothetical protein NCLIV_047180 [Neospora caninum Liverpool]|uniref:ZIP Zinc transporter domain-containing protei n n=1 Tax=Neospora caninum (strain Liverpool) TaxID=572307 RepID=F0VM08_NEOCL|nr:hypothetical protein NCLIV_047180 [Neospora caninum Liverpool]CBZ54286.1 hypothetical protein NCLIV_047180 [Neospora caninum Liverpool]CEL68992.1 TPA: ZIP Zinc transporter domain-containing protei n [Neospora caninum Liverpool]|eukprot:XP_003884317.1 hypothetical protein NCLIV_047180 [Neospora caninum Liverpool]